MPAVTAQLARDITDALARLRLQRELDPRHEVLPGREHVGCELCTAQRRFEWLLERIPR